MKHPLDDAFDVAEDSLLDPDVQSLSIPEDKDERDLDLVIDLALTQYKEIQEIISFVEPAKRIKYLEMQRDFLNIVKDARYKKERLKLEEEKATRSAKSPTKPSGEEKEGKEGEGQGISRADLQKKLRAVT